MKWNLPVAGRVWSPATQLTFWTFISKLAITISHVPRNLPFVKTTTNLFLACCRIFNYNFCWNKKITTLLSRNFTFKTVRQVGMTLSRSFHKNKFAEIKGHDLLVSLVDSVMQRSNTSPLWHPITKNPEDLPVGCQKRDFGFTILPFHSPAISTFNSRPKIILQRIKCPLLLPTIK